MRGVSFRIFPNGRQWGWQVFTPCGHTRTQGQAATRAEAAAYVIRETIRSVVPAEQDFINKAA